MFYYIIDKWHSSVQGRCVRLYYWIVLYWSIVHHFYISTCIQSTMCQLLNLDYILNIRLGIISLGIIAILIHLYNFNKKRLKVYQWMMILYNVIMLYIHRNINLSKVNLNVNIICYYLFLKGSFQNIRKF